MHYKTSIKTEKLQTAALAGTFYISCRDVITLYRNDVSPRTGCQGKALLRCDIVFNIYGCEGLMSLYSQNMINNDVFRLIFISSQTFLAPNTAGTDLVTDRNNKIDFSASCSAERTIISADGQKEKSCIRTDGLILSIISHQPIQPTDE